MGDKRMKRAKVLQQERPVLKSHQFNTPVSKVTAGGARE
jgi:hypothetical protein